MFNPIFFQCNEQVFGRTSGYFKANDLYCMSQFPLALMNAYHPSPKTVLLHHVFDYITFITPHLVNSYPEINDFRAFLIQRPNPLDSAAHIYVRFTVSAYDQNTDPWQGRFSMTPNFKFAVKRPIYS